MTFDTNIVWALVAGFVDTLLLFLIAGYVWGQAIAPFVMWRVFIGFWLFASILAYLAFHGPIHIGS